MAHIGNISAVLFDMDGTLVDSETLTGPVIRQFCAGAGLPAVNYRWADFYGVSWYEVARRIAADHLPRANAGDVARQLHEVWERLCTENPPLPVPGAREAVIAAHARMPTAIVSSAFRESIDRMVRRLSLEAFVTRRVGAEEYARSKPAPDGFLHAADLLGVAPSSCLVFEDSIAGLQSAREAGMSVIAITQRSNDAAHACELADRAIVNYHSLDGDFFDRIACAPGSDAAVEHIP